MRPPTLRPPLHGCAQPRRRRLAAMARPSARPSATPGPPLRSPAVVHPQPLAALPGASELAVDDAPPIGAPPAPLEPPLLVAPLLVAPLLVAPLLVAPLLDALAPPAPGLEPPPDPPPPEDELEPTGGGMGMSASSAARASKKGFP